MKFSVTSWRKQLLRIAASSARNGGTRRVLTSPLRGAFAITARAQMPARFAKPTGTLRSLRAAVERKVNILFASPHGSMKGSTMVALTDMVQIAADEPAARGNLVAETSTAAVSPASSF